MGEAILYAFGPVLGVIAGGAIALSGMWVGFKLSDRRENGRRRNG